MLIIELSCLFLNFLVFIFSLFFRRNVSERVAQRIQCSNFFLSISFFSLFLMSSCMIMDWFPSNRIKVFDAHPKFMELSMIP